jgi:adenylate kinase
MPRLGFDLIILGAPAAGKDTQAELLVKKYGLKKVESGKYWRKMAKQKNSLGDLLRRTFSKGQPAPVKFMKFFIVKELSKVSKKRDLIFIGNPRLKPEAQFLAKLLKTKGRDFFVINIDLPSKEIRERSIKRMRDIQDWKYVDNRIKMYRLQVSKTLNYFNSLNKLKVVNGNQSISKVAQNIQKAINDYQRSQTTRGIKEKRTHSR